MRSDGDQHRRRCVGHKRGSRDPGDPAEIHRRGEHLWGRRPPVLGSTLTCNSKWEGEPEPTITYVWLTDGGPIEGANTKTHEVTKFDEGHHLACEVIATNPGGQERVVSPRVSSPGAPRKTWKWNAADGRQGCPRSANSSPATQGCGAASPPRRSPISGSSTTQEIAGADRGNLRPGTGTARRLRLLRGDRHQRGRQPGSVERKRPPDRPPHGQEARWCRAPRRSRRNPRRNIPPPPRSSPSLERQLSAALKKARRSGMLKHGSYSFSFESPTGGKLEVLCYPADEGQGELEGQARAAGSRAEHVRQRLQADPEARASRSPGAATWM